MYELEVLLKQNVNSQVAVIGNNMWSSANHSY